MGTSLTSVQWKRYTHARARRPPESQMVIRVRCANRKAKLVQISVDLSWKTWDYSHSQKVKPKLNCWRVIAANLIYMTLVQGLKTMLESATWLKFFNTSLEKDGLIWVKYNHLWQLGINLVSTFWKILDYQLWICWDAVLHNEKYMYTFHKWMSYP